RRGGRSNGCVLASPDGRNNDRPEFPIPKSPSSHRERAPLRYAGHLEPQARHALRASYARTRRVAATRSLTSVQRRIPLAFPRAVLAGLSGLGATYPCAVVDVPRTLYAKSDDTYLAYQVLGDGPLDVVLLSEGFISIDSVDEEPSLARFHRRVASFSRLLRFDRRGVGLSDPASPSNPPTPQ